MFRQELDCQRNEDDKMEFICELLNPLIGLPQNNQYFLSGIFSGFWGQLFEGEDNKYINKIEFEKFFRGLYQDLERIVNEKASEKLISFCIDKLQGIHSIGNHYCDLLKIWEIRYGGGIMDSRSILSNTSCKTPEYDSYSSLNNDELKSSIRNYFNKLSKGLEECIAFFSNKEYSMHSSKLLVVVMAIYCSLTLDCIHNSNSWDLYSENRLDKKFNPMVYALRDKIKEFQWSLGYSLTQFTKESYSKLKDLNYTLKAAANINELNINLYEYPTKTVGANKVNSENIVIADDNKDHYKIFKIQPNTLEMAFNGAYSSDHQTTQNNRSFYNKSDSNNTNGNIEISRLNDKPLLKGIFKLKDEKQFNSCIVSVHFSNYYTSSIIKPNDNYEFTFYVAASSSKTNQFKSFVERVDLKSFEYKDDVPNEIVTRTKALINNKVNPGFLMDKLVVKIEKFTTNIVIDNIQINLLNNIDKNIPSFPQL
ncbi:hypothetical protein DICPUDRAFT_90347 [Dictyostelium purpureum]|uniref:Uncharacterized protein n=1 Tax=Dictyostelium purpureum TaxID=5786 RepID=F1A1Y6_DICPU|nr:uncharacterized protein DICPUDRAFT_90347 [Dictyostelium purpureum]EGC29797.1 hypothetical protein DICPUDRAFT_90347 [Dictyostelium purpureum]|eukprot:XP_003293683.1 hypothetical protein DICPUDRAFT_90347 [Dictyostelium purpureum]